MISCKCFVKLTPCKPPFRSGLSVCFPVKYSLVARLPPLSLSKHMLSAWRGAVRRTAVMFRPKATIASSGGNVTAGREARCRWCAKTCLFPFRDLSRQWNFLALCVLSSFLFLTADARLGSSETARHECSFGYACARMFPPFLDQKELLFRSQLFPSSPLARVCNFLGRFFLSF